MEANSHSMVNFSEDRPSKLIQEAVEDVSSIQKLRDELLLEILIRLPNCESATRCKCVSKRWLHLISSNFFVSLFERNRRKTPLPFALMIRYLRQRSHVYCKDKEANFDCFGLTSNFLPQPSPVNKQGPPQIVAVHNDLLLFCIGSILEGQSLVNLSITRTYVICNPRTKQWISLPPITAKFHLNFASAIVSEPYCSSENCKKGKDCIQDSYRFRVFSIQLTDSSGLFGSDPSAQPQLYVYKSETCLWEKKFLPRISANPLSFPTMYNGKLHFLNQSNIVAFDPFGAEDEGGVVLCCVIDVPSEANSLDYIKHLGTSSGSLLLCMRHYDQSIFKVWDLKDYDKGEWHLKHEFCMIDLMGIEANAIDATAVRNMRVMGFHPYDIDIIYVFYDHCIHECNMQARTSNVVYECQGITDARTPEGNKDASFEGFYRVFLPWWPTPVPSVT